MTGAWWIFRMKMAADRSARTPNEKQIGTRARLIPVPAPTRKKGEAMFHLFGASPLTNRGGCPLVGRAKAPAGAGGAHVRRSIFPLGPGRYLAEKWDFFHFLLGCLRRR